MGAHRIHETRSRARRPSSSLQEQCGSAQSEFSLLLLGERKSIQVRLGRERRSRGLSGLRRGRRVPRGRRRRAATTHGTTTLSV